MSARGFLGAGDLYISRFDPTVGKFLPLEGPYEATKFEIKPNSQIRELTSRGRDSYGQVIESVPLQQPADFSVEMPEVNKASLTTALLGKEAAASQTAGSFAANTTVNVSLGKWVDLGKSNIIESGFTVKNAAGTVTYVKGTDYEVNTRLGWLRALPGGALADNTSVTVAGSYGAVSGVAIRGAVEAQVRARFFLDGKNQVDGSDVQVDVYEVVVAADAAFDFLLDDFNTVALNGRMKTPTGKQEPFVVKLLGAS